VAYTQTTATEITLVNVTLPGGAMGANGSVDSISRWQFNNNANGKQTRDRLSTSSVVNNTNTSAVGAAYRMHTQNRGAQNRQIAGWNGFGISYALASVAIPQIMSVDTSVDVSYNYTANLLVAATDFVILDSFVLQVLPS
jgi:hypothetical protein